MAKKHRLAVAGLTDVGKRRERNQDNVTHFVPDDDEVLEHKGALFVVCDGMGGHAAGEVAAEIGVNSLRDIYFQSDDKDVIAGVANAIKRANEAIYTYAREHAGMTGMGTTCVALLVHGGRGYFVNIGDSRAYLVRDGAMRQVTLDHSWVAEQVRAGVLTEEQARTHAHRNVITRSLGTQPTVSADLFIETLHDGDRVLLCSDGLHGYVEESEIEREMLTHADAEVGAQHLIDMANANGGPDNITALIVHLLEVPEVSGELTLPLSIEEDPEQIITRPIPAIHAPAPAPSAIIDEKVAELRRARRRRPSHVAAIAVRMLAVAALLVVSLGIWDLGLGPFAQMRAATNRLDSDIAAAVQVVQASSTLSPPEALAGLAHVRDRLFIDLRDPLADPQSRQQAQSVLDIQVVQAVQAAIDRYDSSARIQPITSSGISLLSIACAIQGQSSPITLQAISASMALPLPAAMPGTARSQVLYTLDNGVLYQMTTPVDDTGVPTGSSVACGAVPVPNATTIVAAATDGPTLYALAQRSGGAYFVVALTPAGYNPDGTASVKAQERFDVATPQGEVPQLIAVQGDTTYVAYRSSSGGPAGIWVYSGSAPKAPAHSVVLAQAPTALAAAGGTAFAILADGSLGALDPAFAYQSLSVQVLSPLAPGLTQDYSPATPVPTVATPTAGGTDQAGSAGAAFPGGATLTVDPAVKSQLIVNDPANMRVIRLNVGAAGASAGLDTQYVYGAPLKGLKGVAVSASGASLATYGWNGSQLAAFLALPSSTGA